MAVTRLKGTYKSGPDCLAYGVNDGGMVVGEMATGRSNSRAFLFANGTMKNLGSLTTANSWNDSLATAVNGAGNAVGDSMTGTAPEHSGLLYVYYTGTTYNVADAIVSGAAQYQSLIAKKLADINESGVICGPSERGVVSNVQDRRAFMLLPVGP